MNETFAKKLLMYIYTIYLREQIILHKVLSFLCKLCNLLRNEGFAWWFRLRPHIIVSNDCHLIGSFIFGIEGVRIKTRLSHIFMKNELRMFLFRKPG